MHIHIHIHIPVLIYEALVWDKQAKTQEVPQHFFYQPKVGPVKDGTEDVLPPGLVLGQAIRPEHQSPLRQDKAR